MLLTLLCSVLLIVATSLIAMRWDGVLAGLSPALPLIFYAASNSKIAIEQSFLIGIAVPVFAILIRAKHRSLKMRFVIPLILSVTILSSELIRYFGSGFSKLIPWTTSLVVGSILLGIFSSLQANRIRLYWWTATTSGGLVSVLAIATGDLGASRSGSILGMTTNYFAIYAGIGAIAGMSLGLSGNLSLKVQFGISILVAANIVGVAHSASTAGALILVVGTALAIRNRRHWPKVLSTAFPVGAFCLLVLTFGNTNIDVNQNSQKTTKINSAVIDKRNLDLNARDSGRVLVSGRQIDERMSSGMNRVDLALGHFDLYLDKSLLGYGSLSIPDVKIVSGADSFSIGQAAHNTFISLLEAYGLIFLVPIVWFAGYLFFRIRSRDSVLLVFVLACGLIDLEWSYLVLPFGALIGMSPNNGLTKHPENFKTCKQIFDS